MFKLHKQLENDLIEIGDLKVSKLMLLADIENPWFVLVPAINNISEWHQLEFEKQLELTKEINMVSLFLDEHFKPDKINIGSLGNMVPQLHIHIIARYKTDQRWPGALWGVEHKTEQVKIEKLVKLAQIHFDFS